MQRNQSPTCLVLHQTTQAHTNPHTTTFSPLHPSGYQTIQTSHPSPTLSSLKTSNPHFSYNRLATTLDSNTIGTPVPPTPSSPRASRCPSRTSSAPSPRRWYCG
ncbi:predicted protein [Plenodomus lingam JN3]|uniref:Predicted protein n=1 Tax=Leptosphaeria maculans (strain JN3 / isolate v23.1.3 / race Av1-4-5-6-7-8) TaxID=985895 RepID=E4ZZB7_LEPMJ|nr:predicted protein [Plenodomus lingam JN3]CBX96712.1 predicted protein [Plenodomus lingam JN3]